MSATQPFISVIVPTRNRVDWLRRCLDGIAEQDYPDYEVVFVDINDTLLAGVNQTCFLLQRLL